MANSSTSATRETSRMPLYLVIPAAVLLIIALAITIPTQSDWWQIVILGIVQGLTEFLPISSTGHLLIASDLLNYQGSIGGTFEIFIQFGTVIAVVVYYANDLFGQARALLGQTSKEETRAAWRMWISLFIAFLPLAVIGLIFRDFIKTVLYDTPQVIAGALIVGGIIFIVIELLPKRKAPTLALDQVTPLQALGIGIAQAFALIPGMSRSGSTIVGSLLVGLDRKVATNFAFYLSIPTLGLATLVDLVSNLDQIQPADWGRLFLGAVVAMIVGWLSIGWLLRYVARNTFVSFGIYRIIAGLVILALAAIGRL